jgi:hypothetical protein
MIARQELGLIREFFTGPPSMVGLEEGGEIFKLQRGGTSQGVGGRLFVSSATSYAPKPALTDFPAATPDPMDMPTPAVARAATIIAQTTAMVALTNTAISAANFG